MKSSSTLTFVLRAVAIVWAAEALLSALEGEWVRAGLAGMLSMATVVIVALAVQA